MLLDPMIASHRLTDREMLHVEGTEDIRVDTRRREISDRHSYLRPT